MSARKAAVILAVAAAVALPVSDMFAKELLQRHAFATIAAVRFAVMAAMVGGLFMFQGGGAALLLPNKWTLQIVRSGFAATALVLFLEGLRHLPLADCVAISFIQPMLTSIIAAYWLGEAVRRDAWVALIVGFCGVLLVARPGSEAFSWYALYPLAAALGLSCYLVLTRKLGAFDDPRTTTFVGALVCAIVFSPVLLYNVSWSSLRLDWYQVVGVGVFAGAGQLMLAYAFKYAPAAIISPLGYLTVAVSVVLGWMWFNSFPDAIALAGIGVICVAGVGFTSRAI